ncbi:MAG: double zinc ribbon domain-containing protein, partial [Armatimonadota bacterium]|nr:double zinc ribbon domain-containing protein [Armatimonadota bacterium]
MNPTLERLTNVLSLSYSSALDAIFPPRCAGCQTWSKEIFCPACRASLQPIVPPLCAVCGKPFDPLAHSATECAECRDNRYHGAPPFDALRSVYRFEGAVRQAVHRFKYHDKIALAAPLADLLHEFLAQQDAAVPAIPTDRLALLTPVPLHPWRRYRRGYNQSGLLAQELGKRLAVPSGEVLRRTRHTSPQIELS